MKLVEMPHIEVGNNAVDLELEVHADMKSTDFIDYIRHWIDKGVVKSKSGIQMKLKSDNEVHDFTTKLLNNYFFKRFVIKTYGETVWDKIELLLTA